MTSRRGTTFNQRWNNIVYINVGIYNVKQRQINFVVNDVVNTNDISALLWTTLGNVKTALPFSISSFTKLDNVETTLKYNHFQKKKQITYYI